MIKLRPRLQVDDLGRSTYDGLKAKLKERDTQLDEALQIIAELNSALQGVRLCGDPCDLRTLPAVCSV